MINKKKQNSKVFCKLAVIDYIQYSQFFHSVLRYYVGKWKLKLTSKVSQLWSSKDN